MLVLADDILGGFFDHGFAESFRLTEKPVERQRSLGREIFDSLFASGVKFANSKPKQPLSPTPSKASAVPSVISSAPSTSTTPTIRKEDPLAEESVVITSKDDEKSSSNDSEDDKAPTVIDEKQKQEEKPSVEESDKEEDEEEDEEDEEDDEDGDVLEEVDRLLKEYGDEHTDS